MGIGEGDGKKELVPGEDHGQQRRHRDPGKGDGQDDAQQHLPVGGAVHAARFQQILRDVAEEGVHDPDDQREVDCGVDNDQRPERIEQVQMLEDEVERNEHAHRRHELGRDEPE